MHERVGLPYPRAPFYFALVLLTAILGFYPTYFSRLGQTDAVHHFHGVMASLWMLMLIGQSALVRTRRIALHRVIGRSSLLVVPLFLVSGVLVVHTMLASTEPFNRTYGARLAFIDLTTMIYFAAAYALAIAYRRQVQLHARLMASTAILVLPPALARALLFFGPGIHGFDAAFHGAYLICDLVVMALLVDDARRVKIRAPYAVLLVFTVFQQVGFLVLPQLSWWEPLLR